MAFPYDDAMDLVQENARLCDRNAALRVALGKIVDLADDYSTEQTRFWRSVAIAQAAVAKDE